MPTKKNRHALPEVLKKNLKGVKATPKKKDRKQTDSVYSARG